MTTSPVSSSLSTGGAGTFFERDVDAYWLAQLLLSAIPPILIDTQVIEVSFQTEHLGWKTDDVLITCRGAGAVRRKLAAQVKRTFTVSSSDEECSKAILDFYQDFKNPAQFSTDHDRLVLIVQRGTNTLLGDFGRLLDCARASRDGADFAHRLATAGFISNKAVHYADEICQIVGAHEGRTFTHAEIWPFLKLIYVLGLDLDTAIAIEKQARIAAKNLRQMERSLTVREAEAIHSILSAQSEFYGAYGEAVSVGQILLMMKSEEDRAVVREFLGDSARNIVATVDEESDYINKFLPEIAAPAASAEASKIRDSMIEVRNLFAPFASKSGG